MSTHVHAIRHMPSTGTGWATCDCGATIRIEVGRPVGSWHTCELCTAPWGLGLLLALVLSIPLSAQILTGPARVVDGDTLEVQGQKVRLHGIDAPEIRQTCTRAGKVWACGVAARRHLEELIARRPVTCTKTDTDRYGRIVARCFVDLSATPGRPHVHLDLGGWMVRNGHAIAYTRYSTDYVPQETAARGARLGLWSGTFVPPAEWRKGVR